MLTPADLESTFGLTEGNIFHGELTLQQLFSLRPVVNGLIIPHLSKIISSVVLELILAVVLQAHQERWQQKKNIRHLVMKSYDIIIIGAGINGLITASILGKKGKSVLLLESRDKIGGMASTMEFAPGFKCNAINDTIKWIDPRVIKFLDLYTNGLEIIQPDILKTIIGDDNEHILFHKRN